MLDRKCFMKDIHADILQLIISYAFYKKLKITEENVQELLFASDFLMIDSLIAKCCDYMRFNLSISNCIDTYRASSLLNHLDIEDYCHRFIMVHFESIVKQQRNALESLELEDVKKLVSGDDLNVSEEFTVWKVVQEWIECDVQNRLSSLPYLLSILRLGEKGMAEIKDHVTFDIPDVQLVRERFRRPLPPTASYFIIKKQKNNNVCRLSYDEQLDFWRSVCTIKLWPNSISLGPNLKVYFSYHYYFSILDVSQGTLTRIAEFRTNRLDYGCATVRDRLYIIGGTVFFPRHTHLRSVDCFDVHSRSWLWVQSTLYPCKGPVAVLQDKIYAFGTHYDDEMHRTVISGECYDPEKNKWTILPPLIAPFEKYFGVFALHNCVHVCGQNKKTVHFLCYNPELSKWGKKIKNLMQFFSNPKITLLQNTVIIYEGSETGKHSRSFLWDEKTSKWKVPQQQFLKDLRRFQISCFTDHRSLEMLRDRSPYQWERIEDTF